MKKFSFFIVLCSALILSGAEYFVTPADSLQKAFDKLRPGDILTLKEGVYRQGTVTSSIKGTAAKPIIIRGEERIVEAPLPDVFTNIPAEEYDLLAPLSAKAFVEEDRRKMVYLEPERFTDAPKEVWDGYFFSKEPDGYFEGAHMDFNVIVP